MNRGGGGTQGTVFHRNSRPTCPQPPSGSFLILKAYEVRGDQRPGWVKKCRLNCPTERAHSKLPSKSVQHPPKPFAPRRLARKLRRHGNQEFRGWQSGRKLRERGLLLQRSSKFGAWSLLHLCGNLCRTSGKVAPARTHPVEEIQSHSLAVRQESREGVHE